MPKNCFVLLCLFSITFSFCFADNGFSALAKVPAAANGDQQDVQSLLTEGAIREQLDLGEGLNERDLMASSIVTNEFNRHASTVEWLAPLAPVALSPFFGITLLSGLACYGSDWLPENALLSEGSPLANPALFWTFLVLTILTSLPRFSKVSKPIAQMADFLETYSAIVILIVLKAMTMDVFSEPTEEVAMVQAGILSTGWEGFLMLAMAINVVVVNSVKFFFEILVWITPIPFLDACFEVANKSVCVVLMAIYAYSPIVALILNLLIFAVCLIVFFWVRRREIFFRSMLIDWLADKFFASKAAVSDSLVVFPNRRIGCIPSRAKCLLVKSESGWTLTHYRMLRPHLTQTLTDAGTIVPGWWTHAILMPDDTRLTFGSRYSRNLDQVAGNLGLSLKQLAEENDRESERQIEFRVALKPVRTKGSVNCR